MKRNTSICKKSFLFSFILCALAGLVFMTTAAMPALGAVTQTAVVAAAAADWSSSAVSVIPVDTENDAHTAQNDLLAQSISDITLSSFGRYFYLLTRSGSNTVAKIDISDPETVIWQYSTEGEEEGSNPYSLVFVNSKKAYLIRYGSPKAWIVNPSATSESDFKIGELDLSDYDDGDGAPEMAGGIIAGGKLFVIMQRLDFSSGYATPTEAKPYVAVFDVETDTEIDTAMGEGNLKGIPLDLKNPLAIQFLAENDTLYVQCMGWYYGAYQYEGGIVAIDAYDYSTTLVLDDGDSDSHPYGNISGMAMVSPTKGYFVGYDGWLDNTLYTFDPSADAPIGTAIQGLQGKGIAGMESGIYADKNAILWVCNQTDAQVELLDTVTDTIVESVGTNLNPSKVVFTVEGFVEDDDNENGIADVQEVSGTVDLDGDGVDDEITDTYKFLQTEVGEAQVALAATENVNAILTMAALDPADALADTTGTVPAQMPYGLLDFSLSVPTGATAQVTLYFSEDVGVTQWYKYTDAAGWEDYSDNAVFSTLSDGRTQVVLTLEDGGIGDADGVANGIITDPSGPGTDVSSSEDAVSETTDSTDDTGSDGGSGTCFISSITGDAPMAAHWPGGLLLLAMLLAAVPALRRSRN